MLQIAYIIKIEGRQYLIHLKKQSFLSLASVVSSYDKKDTLHSKSLIVQMDCNYQGYVAGFPNSLVTLNTCSGLRGILQFQNISYGIEPMEAISGFVHMIYEEKNDNINVPLLRDSDISAWSNDLQSKARKSSKRTEFSNLSPRYIEMHIVVDKNLFDYMGSDIKVVTQKVILIVGLVNAMLAQLKLTVIISSIEIWSNKNQFSTTGQPSDLLIRLVEWEGKYLVPQPHHNTYFFVFRKYPSFIGTTFPGKMCYKTYAKGVALISIDLVQRKGQLFDVMTGYAIFLPPLFLEPQSEVQECNKVHTLMALTSIRGFLKGTWSARSAIQWISSGANQQSRSPGDPMKSSLKKTLLTLRQPAVVKQLLPKPSATKTFLS
nr:disintegrin and metalloproteinase domain-containing protein 5-like [Loxodonta africana]